MLTAARRKPAANGSKKNCRPRRSSRNTKIASLAKTRSGQSIRNVTDTRKGVNVRDLCSYPR